MHGKVCTCAVIGRTEVRGRLGERLDQSGVNESVSVSSLNCSKRPIKRNSVGCRLEAENKQQFLLLLSWLDKVKKKLKWLSFFLWLEQMNQTTGVTLEVLVGVFLNFTQSHTSCFPPLQKLMLNYANHTLIWLPSFKAGWDSNVKKQFTFIWTEPEKSSKGQAGGKVKRRDEVHSR